MKKIGKVLMNVLATLFSIFVASPVLGIVWSIAWTIDSIRIFIHSFDTKEYELLTMLLAETVFQYVERFDKAEMAGRE